ncbi:MAG: aldehyde dehydrogenase family protein, partial [Candidatus Nanopelagicales bacterium]
MTHDHSGSEPKPFWIAGEPRTSETVVTVKSPFNGAVAGSYYVPTALNVEQAVAGAHDSIRASASLTASARAAALDHISRQIAARSEEIASVITSENGKPIMWANAEVGRAVSTFRWAAEEARRWSGDLQRLDTDPAAAGRLALVRRFSKGPILGIAPFNFPLNLVAHKVAPALAIGAPIIIKPAPATPLSALILGEIMAETDLPVGSWSVLPIGNDETRDLVQDERLPVISFTGSETVGYAIQAAVPRKHVTLELGGNAAAVVLEDWSSNEDLEWAATRAAMFANYQAGQSCISVQRVIVDSTLAEKFVP